MTDRQYETKQAAAASPVQRARRKLKRLGPCASSRKMRPTRKEGAILGTLIPNPDECRLRQSVDYIHLFGFRPVCPYLSRGKGVYWMLHDETGNKCLKGAQPLQFGVPQTAVHRPGNCSCASQKQ